MTEYIPALTQKDEGKPQFSVPAEGNQQILFMVSSAMSIVQLWLPSLVFSKLGALLIWCH
jgi:hypothetical protein